MIKYYALIALQKATHQALSLDVALPVKLASLHGRVLKMVIKPLDVSFFIQFTREGLIFLEEYSGLVDTTIHSSPLGFIRLSILPASKVRSLFNEAIEMTGDVTFGQQVKEFFDELDLDWEGHLAQFTGDAIAHQLGHWMRQGQKLTRRLGDTMQQNVTEYLQEECRLFPSREEVNDFFNDVDELSMHVERLSVHVDMLVNQRMNPHEND
jgi:ubiquinone biosynthesis protein UbiJ